MLPVVFAYEIEVELINRQNIVEVFLHLPCLTLYISPYARAKEHLGFLGIFLQAGDECIVAENERQDIISPFQQMPSVEMTVR